MTHNANNNAKWEQFSANQRALRKQLSANKPEMGEIQRKRSADQRPKKGNGTEASFKTKTFKLMVSIKNRS